MISQIYHIIFDKSKSKREKKEGVNNYYNRKEIGNLASPYSSNRSFNNRYPEWLTRNFAPFFNNNR